MNCKILCFTFFLIFSNVFAEDEDLDCPNSKRDKTLNIHSWRYYSDLDDTYYFYKNGSTAAWILASGKTPAAFLCKGSVTEEPIMALDGVNHKVYDVYPITIDMLVNDNFRHILDEMLEKNQAYDLDVVEECLSKEFQSIYSSIAWSAGEKATLKALAKLRETFTDFETGAAKEFYDDHGSITMTRDIIWITDIIHAVGELVKSNSGILHKLRKEKKLDFDEQKMMNQETPGDTIKEILKQLSQVEDLSKIIGEKNEAQSKIENALKMFGVSDQEAQEIGQSLVKEFF